jgi:hypothetical protein
LAILAILNSRLISRIYLAQVTQATKDDFPQVTIQDVLALPWPDTAYDRLAELAQLALKHQRLTEALATARFDRERDVLGNAVAKTDRDIDELVYQLYGLTPEEIALVEGTSLAAPDASAASSGKSLHAD